jgi:hypothetical protein
VKQFSEGSGNPRATRQLAYQNVVNLIAKSFRFGIVFQVFILHVMPDLELFLLT